MKDLPIKSQKPVKVGNSYYFTIPSQYIKNEAIMPESLYTLQIGKISLEGLRPVRVGESFYFPISIDLIKDSKIDLLTAYDIIINECSS